MWLCLCHVVSDCVSLCHVRLCILCWCHVRSCKHVLMSCWFCLYFPQHADAWSGQYCCLSSQWYSAWQPSTEETGQLPMPCESITACICNVFQGDGTQKWFWLQELMAKWEKQGYTQGREANHYPPQALTVIAINLVLNNYFPRFNFGTVGCHLTSWSS